MEGVYKINLAPSDLSVEETIFQIADTLDNLDGIVTDVFMRIMSRIKVNEEKTNNIKKRIAVTNEQVNKLSGMQKALKVYSSAKYPASINHEPYISVFNLECYKYEPKKTDIISKPTGYYNDKEQQDKLHFFHVKVGDPHCKVQMKPDMRRALSNVSSVGELLVFNTDECPYIVRKKTVRYQPSINESVIERSQSDLEAAPSSIVNRDLIKQEIDEYMYAPGMGLVPELEMPTDLPHLTGVAGDVKFSSSLDEAIAPSAVASPSQVVEKPFQQSLPKLPDLPVDEQLPVLPVLPDSPDSGPIAAVDVSPVAVTTPLPPPPPPPMPVMESTTPTSSHKNKDAETSVPKTQTGDAHANLMEAIRSAGGVGKAKLKSATAIETDNKSKKPLSTGDLMADLHAKLSMRRRGISGAERSGSVLQTLANIIPEPVESTPQQSSSEDDWE